jgi:hypothetical protein
MLHEVKGMFCLWWIFYFYFLEMRYKGLLNVSGFLQEFFLAVFWDALGWLIICCRF